MQTKVQSLLLMMAAMAIGNTSAAPNINLKSILNDPSSINLFRELYEYIGAVMNQGIPALNVPPSDPLYLNHTVQLQIPIDPDYPNYTNIDIQVNGFNISDFSDFVVPIANLDLDDMSALLILDDDNTFVQMCDVVSSATDLDGRLLQYNCSTIYATMFGNSYLANKQFELNGTYLQVEHFNLEFSTAGTSVILFYKDCTGDIEIVDVIFDHVVEAFNDVAFSGIGEHLQNLSREYTTILNDIFALRNVTDDDSTKLTKPEKTPQDFSNALSNPDLGDETTVRRSTKRSSRRKSVHKPKDNRVTIKWNGLNI